MFGGKNMEVAAPAASTLGSSALLNSEADMRSKANDRALKILGVRELNLDNLPEGAKIANLPNQVRKSRRYPNTTHIQFDMRGVGVEGGGNICWRWRIGCCLP